ncbi:hypothetical protein GCM10009846_19490 [Agrococcus versicolor]|uniref:Tetratrico peptide repeat group 5 domain-containing protein n=1 Tax=Agrococcus versicolor TaxID=501482 RepID=A0ABN3ASL0_9MICO
MSDWQERIDAFWAELDEDAPQAMIRRMRALVAELAADDARGPFELGGVFDALGMEEVAAAHYRRALELGLDDERAARLAIQHGSTLRNLGRIDEAIDVLAHAPDHDAVGDARAIFLALALHDAGRSGEAVRLLVEALEPTLPSYRRSVRAYAEALPEPPRHGA